MIIILKFCSVYLSWTVHLRIFSIWLFKICLFYMLRNIITIAEMVEISVISKDEVHNLPCKKI